MREPTTTSIVMAAKRSNRVMLTKEQHVQAKQARMDHARRFNEAIQDAQTIIGELIDKISLKFNLSLDHVAEKLHLGGHAVMSCGGIKGANCQKTQERVGGVKQERGSRPER